MRINKMIERFRRASLRATQKAIAAEHEAEMEYYTAQLFDKLADDIEALVKAKTPGCMP